VKKILKSVNIRRSYGQYCSALFSLTHSVDTKELKPGIAVLKNGNNLPSYMCGFMALSPAAEELDKKFLCKSGVFNHEMFKESAPK